MARAGVFFFYYFAGYFWTFDSSLGFADFALAPLAFFGVGLVTFSGSLLESISDFYDFLVFAFLLFYALVVFAGFFAASVLTYSFTLFAGLVCSSLIYGFCCLKADNPRFFVGAGTLSSVLARTTLRRVLVFLRIF